MQIKQNITKYAYVAAAILLFTKANAYVTGTYFPMSNQGAIMQNLSLATVGLEITLTNGQKFECSAVAIGSNKFLTVAHCLSENNSIPTSNFHKLEIKQPDSSGGIIKIGTDFKKELLKFSRSSWPYTTHSYNGEDYVIVTITGAKFKNYINLAMNAVRTKALIKQNYTIIDKEVDFPLFAEGLHIYGLAYNGLKNKFQFGHMLTSGYSSTVILKNDAFITFGNSPQSIFAEEGDSGGPMYVCNTNVTNCKLIGIEDMISRANKSTYFLPLYQIHNLNNDLLPFSSTNTPFWK